MLFATVEIGTNEPSWQMYDSTSSKQGQSRFGVRNATAFSMPPFFSRGKCPGVLTHGVILWGYAIRHQ